MYTKLWTDNFKARFGLGNLGTGRGIILKCVAGG